MREVRHPLHFVAGSIATLSALISWGLPVALTGIFICYEIIQDKYEHDKAYPDLLEFLIASFVTAAFMVGLQIGGLL